MKDKLKREDLENPERRVLCNPAGGEVSYTPPDRCIYLSNGELHAVYAALRQAGKYELIRKIARQVEAPHHIMLRLDPSSPWIRNDDDDPA